METQKKQTAGKPITVILVLCLCAAGLVTTILRQQSAIPMAREVLAYVGYILVFAYALVGYRVPHGNLLKYTMLCFAVLLVVTMMSNPALNQGAAAPAGGEGAPPAAAEALPQPDGAPDVPGRPDFQAPGQEKRSNLAELALVGASIILISYMAGRLNRIKENRIIIVLVLILLIVRAIFENGGLRNLPVGLNEIYMWLALSASYLFRYREHREAGLLDKAQAEEASKPAV